MAPDNAFPTTEPSPKSAFMRMLLGYQVTQALYVAARLGIADLLKDGPRRAEEIAPAAGAHAPSLHRLMRALASLSVLDEVEEGVFAVTPLGRCLQTGTPDSLHAAVLFFGDLSYQRFAHLLYSVQTGQTTTRRVYGTDDAWAYFAQNPEAGAVFNRAMTDLARGRLAASLRAYDFSRFRVIVDVGGGQGMLLAGILRANPAARGVLFDLPEVVDGAHALLSAEGVSGRCEVVGGSFFDGVPEGGDAYVLSLVLHDWDDGAALEILQNCRRAMHAQSKLLVVEAVLPPTKSGLVEPFLADLNMLQSLGGRERTEPEWRSLLERAGLAVTRIIPTEAGLSVIEAAPS